MNKILVLHGSDSARIALGPVLERENFSPIWATDVETGLHRAVTLHPQLIILDVPIAGISVIELCSQLRDSMIQTPRIVLSSTSDEVERVLLLEMGADDCIPKPFHARELVARIRAVLRRTAPHGGTTIRFGDVEIEPARRVITRGGKEVKLTPCEYNLLLYFVHNRDKPLTRDTILNSVWGYESYPNTRTVDSHVVRLRSKFEPDPSTPKYFLTIHGVGYRFLTEEPISPSN
ncbi:MAG: response regulator transcription factor [Acidobacteriaceae bacterium]|nr:response regulator transcription factor [Acidobacteriaceae bacterium]